MLERKVDYWTLEKEKDLADRDMEIARLEEEQEKQTTEIHDLFVDYIRREKEMDDYKKEREERLKQEAIEEGITKAAIKIQAWWRGCMVRWSLGPYCPDHLKKKKKKCKKK